MLSTRTDGGLLRLKSILFSVLLVLIAGPVLAGNTEEICKPPQGFRFRGGQLLYWGASKQTLLSMLPPRKLGPKSEPSKMVVYCTGDPITAGNSDAARKVEKPGGDGCVVANLEIPRPYYNAVLVFNADRFYGVSAWIHPGDFDEAERSLIDVLGPPKKPRGRYLGDPDDEWAAGDVLVDIARVGSDGVGTFNLLYSPLAPKDSEEKRPLNPPPF